MTKRWTEEETNQLTDYLRKLGDKRLTSKNYDILEIQYNRPRKGLISKTREIVKRLRFEKFNVDFDRSIAIGFDEVGIGCHAGPIVVAGVLLDPERPITGLKDSKKFGGKKKYDKIIEKADEIRVKAKWLGYKVITAEEIGDRTDMNSIALDQTFELLKDIPLRYQSRPYLIDGTKCMSKGHPNVFPGDDTYDLQVAAASILAKSVRCEMIDKIDQLFPDFGFKYHRGYGTKKHRESIQKFGFTPFHRQYYIETYRRKYGQNEVETQ